MNLVMSRNYFFWKLINLPDERNFPFLKIRDQFFLF
uniref:Uncharacterized protein n=1 Tax=Arundo donax TaxID=35708 RepID=A0A0A8ZYC6_ARUDO